MGITIRNARPDDRDGIIALVPRLRAFGPSSLRPIEDLDRAEADALNQALDNLAEDAALLVAELNDKPGIAGVAFILTYTDYFTLERHGHISILSVAESAEGQGVGRALLDAVDEWAKSLGYRFVTLNVFGDNKRARAVYERAGYEIDSIKYAKRLAR